jgi:hypothetical protein
VGVSAHLAIETSPAGGDPVLTPVFFLGGVLGVAVGAAAAARLRTRGEAAVSIRSTLGDIGLWTGAFMIAWGGYAHQARFVSEWSEYSPGHNGDLGRVLAFTAVFGMLGGGLTVLRHSRGRGAFNFPVLGGVAAVSGAAALLALWLCGLGLYIAAGLLTIFVEHPVSRWLGAALAGGVACGLAGAVGEGTLAWATERDDRAC